MNFFQNFGQKVNEFAMNGLGGSFAKGIGTFIAVAFALYGIISFIQHKRNPQSRMMPWFWCLVAAVLGITITWGPAVWISVLNNIAEFFRSMMGI